MNKKTKQESKFPCFIIENCISFIAAFQQTSSFSKIIMVAITDFEKWKGISFHGLKTNNYRTSIPSWPSFQRLNLGPFSVQCAVFSLLKVHNQSSVQISHLRSIEASQCSSALKIIWVQNRRDDQFKGNVPIKFPEWCELDGSERPWQSPTIWLTGSS